MLRILWILLLCLCNLDVFGQPANVCDTVYKHPETAPAFKDGERKLYEQLQDLFSGLDTCVWDTRGHVTDRWKINLVIDGEGKVSDVSVAKPNVNAACYEALKARLMNMPGWLPGKIKGIPVCSSAVILFSCILWHID